MAIDEAKFSALIDRMITEMGVVFGSSLVLVGDRLGLYKALVELGPATSPELAKHTGTFERYVREWLAAQAAAGYVSYDHETGRYFMTEEQAMVFADETSRGGGRDDTRRAQDNRSVPVRKRGWVA